MPRAQTLVCVPVEDERLARHVWSNVEFLRSGNMNRADERVSMRSWRLDCCTYNRTLDSLQSLGLLCGHGASALSCELAQTALTHLRTAVSW